MPERGVTKTGFNDPTHIELYQEYRELWKTLTGRILRERRADDDLARSFLEVLTTKGLDDEDERDLGLWQIVRRAYFDYYVPTARDLGLDLAGKTRLKERFARAKATGVVTYTAPDEADEEIAPGTTFATEAGTEFVTTNGSTITALAGTPVDVKVEAVEFGELGNVAEGAINQVQSTELNGTVSNDKFITHYIVSSQTGWMTLANSERFDNYQVVTTKNLQHPTNLESVRFKVRNPDSTEGIYSAQVVVADHNTGAVLGKSAVLTNKLTASQELEYQFVGIGLDVSGYAKIRLILLNLDTSPGDLEIASGDAGGDKWTANGTEQNTAVAMTLQTNTPGATTGGRNTETNAEFRQRFNNSLHRGGSARLAAIKSELFKVFDMRHVTVLENPTHFDLTDQGGLPPYAIEPICWGGNHQDIIEALGQVVSAGIYLNGNRVGVWKDEFGQEHLIQYSRPQEVPIYLEITIKTKSTSSVDTSFPFDGVTQIRNAVVEYIGGADSNLQIHHGVGIGEDVSHSQVLRAVHTVPGVLTAEVKMGTAADTLLDDVDLTPDNSLLTNKAKPITEVGKVTIIGG